MKKNIIPLGFLLTLTSNIFAIAPGDSTQSLNLHKTSATLNIASDKVTATLSVNDRSNTNKDGEKRFYDTFKVFLNVDDEVTFKQESSKFRTVLSFVNLEKKTQFSFDNQEFSGKSTTSLIYHATTAGVYTLFASSADPEKLGSYTITKTITKVVSEKLSDPFLSSCLKVLDYRKNKYQSILGEKVNEKEGVYTYLSSFRLTGNSTDEITFENGGSIYNYNSILAKDLSEAEAQKLFLEIASKLNNYALSKDWLRDPTPTAKSTLFAISSEQDMITVYLKQSKDKYTIKLVFN